MSNSQRDADKAAEWAKRVLRAYEVASKARGSLKAAEEASKRVSEIYRASEAASNANARASLEAGEKASKRADGIAGGAGSSTTLRILAWLQQSSTFREIVHGTSLGFDFEPNHRYQTFQRSDLEAVLSDWLAVGDDLRRAMREFDDRAPRAEESSGQGKPKQQAIGREGHELARTS